MFAGSFDLAAAAAVTGQDLDGLGRSVTTFVEHSLIEISAPPPTAVGDFGCWSRSATSPWIVSSSAVLSRDPPRAPALLRRLGRRTGLQGRGPIKSGDLDRLQADDANVNAALSWVCAEDAEEPSSVAEGLRLASAVARLWHRRSTVSDGRTYCTLCWTPRPESTVPAAVRAAALQRSAMLAISSGEYLRATVFAAECLELFEQLGDLSGMSWSHRYLAEAALATDDLTRARASAEAQLDLARRAGDRVAEADAYNMLGQSSGRLGNFDEAEAELLQSEAAFRELGNLDGAASVLDSLAELAFRRWDIGLAASAVGGGARAGWQAATAEE